MAHTCGILLKARSAFLALMQKVVERIVHEQSMEFLDKQILYEFKSGF